MKFACDYDYACAREKKCAQKLNELFYYDKKEKNARLPQNYIKKSNNI